MGECRGADWENLATYTIFTFNPNETFTEFRSKNLKQLDML
jgi:hypothetical protein